MDVRVGVLFLLLLGAGWACAAKEMSETEISYESVVISDILAAHVRNQEQGKENQASDRVVQSNEPCTFCEEFVTQTLEYLADNTTQTEVIYILHQACSRVPPFKEPCIVLVDYYVSLFFLEIASVQPDDFCQRINFCEKIAFISAKFQEDKCGLCHRAVSEILIKLKDPDTQLEIIQVLLKACDSMENYAAKCKRMVFEYGPVILANAEQFLESRDICTMLHACNSPKPGSGEAATVVKADS